jgi:hypothetical protein
VRKTVALSVAIAMAVIFLAPSAVDTGIDASEGSPATPAYGLDNLEEWIIDDFNYDDLRISAIFAVLAGIVLILLAREIKKQGIYLEDSQKKPVRECCPQCGCELSRSYDFCPTCGFRPVKR